MTIPKEKPAALSLSAWIDYTIGRGAAIVIPRTGAADLILPLGTPAWLHDFPFNAAVRDFTVRKPSPYLSSILDATIGTLAAARRLSIQEKDVIRLLQNGELGGVKLGSQWRVSAGHCKRLSGAERG
jgi:excisionase family DNA binding protein